MFTVIFFCLWTLFGVFARELVSVTEGDSVSLSVNLNQTQRYGGITWKFGNKKTLIAEIKRNGNVRIHEDALDGRFRHRLTLNQTGSLTITNITITDSGLYHLINTNNNTQLHIFNITLYAHLPVPVITSNSSQCSSCSLTCSVMNVSHVTLSWYKGNSLLSSIGVSDLIIRLSLSLEVEYNDTNTYSCVINNPITNITQHLNTDVCQPYSGYILYLSCAAGSLMIIITALLMYCIRRKHRKTNQEDQTDEQEITYADPTFYKGHKPRSAAVEEDVVYAGVMR